MSPEDFPLVHQLGSSLVAAGLSGGRIVAEMMRGALALSRVDAKAEAALVPRFKIGEHEFCEPDYRQILLWAESLEMGLEMVVERLMKTPSFPARLLRNGSPNSSTKKLCGTFFCHPCQQSGLRAVF